MRFKSKLWMMILALCFIGLLAACSNDDNGNGGGDTTPAPVNEGSSNGDNNSGNDIAGDDSTEDAVFERGPVELVFTSDGGKSEGERFMAYLQQLFPDDKYHYIDADEGDGGKANLISTGQQMDIDYNSIGSTGEALLRYDLQQDIGHLIEKHNVDLNRFDASLIDGMREMTDEGYVFGLPVQDQLMVLLYNKDLFEEFGEQPPTSGMTWEEIFDLAQRMTRTVDGKVYYGLSFDERDVLTRNPMDIPYVDPATGEPTFTTDDRWITLFETLILPFTNISLFTDGEIDQMPDDDDFIEGSVAMFIDAVDPGDMEEDAAFDWDMVAVPTINGYGFAPYPNYYSIMNTTVDEDAAMDVLKRLTGDEYQTMLARDGILPAINTESVISQLGAGTVFPDKNWQEAHFANPVAPIPPKSIHDSQLQRHGRSAIRDIIFKGVDLNSALRKAQESAEKYISEQ